jgi:hypothetical protein
LTLVSEFLIEEVALGGITVICKRDTERTRHIGERKTRELIDKFRGEDATRANEGAE